MLIISVRENFNFAIKSLKIERSKSEEIEIKERIHEYSK